MFFYVFRIVLRYSPPCGERYCGIVPTRNPAPEPRATEPRATEPRATEPRANTEPRASHARERRELMYISPIFCRFPCRDHADRVRKGRVSIFTSFQQFLIFTRFYDFLGVLNCFRSVFNSFQRLKSSFQTVLQRFKTF